MTNDIATRHKQLARGWIWVTVQTQCATAEAGTGFLTGQLDRVFHNRLLHLHLLKPSIGLPYSIITNCTNFMPPASSSQLVDSQLQPTVES